MSSTTSIAQFMALLSGGANPAMLRANAGIAGISGSGQKTAAAADFQSLLGNNVITVPTAANSQTTPEGGVPVSVSDATPIKTPETKAPLPTYYFVTAEDGSLTIQQHDVLKNSVMQNGVLPQLSPEAMEKISEMVEGNYPASAVWQFIRQQASLDGENAIVLNLSEKGIPQDVIDELQKLFSSSDLITILRDPKLNMQLDNALKDTNAETIGTPQLAGVITAILHQNKGEIGNTITFQPDTDAPIDELIEQLVRDGYASDAAAAYMTVRIMPPESNQPVTVTLVRQKLSGGTPVQEATPVAGSASPFSLKGRNDKDASSATDAPLPKPEASSGLNAPQQTTAPKGQEVQSIADRLASIINAGAGGAAKSVDYSSLTLSASGDSLTDIDGSYVMPFEAGFKTASVAANPVLMQQNAAQAHPATQMVALSLTKMASKAGNGEDSQSYRLKLDPPEMGRIDIEMDVIEKTGQLKAVIKAEKPESLGLLQRDMHVLLKAMQDAGFEGMTQQDLTFTLSQGNDQWADNGQGSSGKGNNQSKTDAQDALTLNEITIEGKMTLIVDPVTGQRHVNMTV